MSGSEGGGGGFWERTGVGAGGESTEGGGLRARPASGLWTLLAWLRRDERNSSSDSLSSAGSDRTAASFAFLAPPPPRVLPEPSPPSPPATDSYRRRLRDCDLRRQRDRNLTLHRKYGLYYGYDAFSLPTTRKNLIGSGEERNRDRRATSESLPRRTAYVPGKRRAPLPPTRPHSVASAASLTRRHNRKRPAPQPPVTLIATVNDTANLKENTKVKANALESTEINTKMKPSTQQDRRPLSDANEKPTNATKSSKLNEKEINVKDNKIVREKSFLKQIFENKKRSSTIEPTERLLPSISELDKQAAEIIESCKLKPIEKNNNSQDSSITKEEMWFCTRCLRKYNSTVVTCQYCLPEQKRLSAYGFKGESATQTENKKKQSGKDTTEKQKLKEMLKEMKDSLPKRSKQDKDNKTPPNNVFRFDSTGRNSSSIETATLRIGAEKVTDVYDAPSTSKNITQTSHVTDMSQIEQILPKINCNPVTQNVVITQHVVLVAPQSKCESAKSKEDVLTSCGNPKTSVDSNINNRIVETSNIHTPLRISSLLNPVYIPKNRVENKPQNKLFIPVINSENLKAGHSEQSATTNKPSTVSTSSPVSHSKPDSSSQTELTIVKTSAFAEIKPKAEKVAPRLATEHEKQRVENLSAIHSTPLPATSTTAEHCPTTNVTEAESMHASNLKVNVGVNKHLQRRNLINQLEQSIAKGDEKAAAEAAARLAQLRLSCSVLSFTSKIITPEVLPSTLVNLPLVKQLVVAKQHTPTQPVNKVDKDVNQQIDPTQELTNNELTKSSSVKKEEFKEQIVISQQPKNKVNASVQSIATITLNNEKNNIKEIKIQPKTQEIEPSTSFAINDSQVQQKAPDEKSLVLSKSLGESSSTKDEKNSNQTTIQVWVEDRETTRGPVRLRISRQASMGELRRQAEISFGLAGALQRWIVGRALCTDDRIPLASLAGPNLSTPFYLCVVAAENDNNTTNERTTDNIDNKDFYQANINNKKTSDVYSELVQLEQRAIIFNTDAFECDVCMENCAEGNGAILRECVHMFCRECLSDLVRHSEEPIVTCPAIGCPGVLQEREVRALVSHEEYERWLARGLAAAESGTRNAFHCRTRDCTGWALFDPEVRRFPCPVCKHTNCIPCKAIHEGETCQQHIQKLQEAAAATNSPTAQTDEGTMALLDTLIKKGEALKCPECTAIITKKWGCDWIKCSACKTEICWVTRGRRWGPAGKGDTSGGCRCGVDGKRCHPSCGYCH